MHQAVAQALPLHASSLGAPGSETAAGDIVNSKPRLVLDGEDAMYDFLPPLFSAARGNSNIDVVVDGKHLYKGPLFQGDTKSFNAPNSISIYLSNAGDLDLTLNGEEIAPLGARNQEIRKTFRSK